MANPKKPVTSMTSQQTPNAGLPRRLAALLYDSLLAFAVLALATLLPALLIGEHTPASVDNEQVIHELNPMLSGVGFQLYLMAVLACYFSWFWHQHGQTLAMQAWRLRIEAADGGKPDWRQCLIRLLAACLSIACLGLGYWWILFNSERLSWHDRLSKTRIVQLPKQP